MATLAELQKLYQEYGNQYQANFKLPGGIILSSPTNPGQAATIDVSGGQNAPGQGIQRGSTPNAFELALYDYLKTAGTSGGEVKTLDRSTEEGTRIASQYPVQKAGVDYNVGFDKVRAPEIPPQAPAPSPAPSFFQTPEQREASYRGAGLPVPSPDAIKNLDKTANDLMNAEADKLESAGFKVDLRKSSELAEKLVGALEGDKGKVAAPDLVSEFNKQREALGVGKLESDLAKAESDIAKLEADYVSTLQEEELRPVSMKQIQRRQGAADIAYQRAKRDLVAQKDSIARQLDVKYGTINTIMTLTGKQYDIARGEYEFNFNKTISLLNLVKGIDDSQKNREEQAIDNARADIQIMANFLKDGNVKYSDLPLNVQADIKKTELQAGRPVGFTAYVAGISAGKEILFHTTTPDGKGEMVVYKDGSSKIVNFGAYGGDVKKAEEEIENFKKDVATWIEKLDAPRYSAEHVDWRTAWDALHAKYPQAATETIDNALGLQRRNN